LGAWFFIRPQAATLKSKRAELQQQQALLEGAQQETKDLSRLVTQLQASDREVALLDEALPLETRVTKLQVLLNSLVTASGMRLGPVNVETAALGVAAGDKKTLDNPFGANRKLQTITLDLMVEGNVDQFRNLLRLIESNSRIVDIVSVDITDETEESSFRIKLKAYSYAP
jgi:Tfp pilus assembly protein PilO